MKSFEGASYSYKSGDQTFKITISNNELIRQFNFVTMYGDTINDLVPEFIEPAGNSKVYEFTPGLVTKAAKGLPASSRLPNSILCIIEGTAKISTYDGRYYVASITRLLRN